MNEETITAIERLADKLDIRAAEAIEHMAAYQQALGLFAIWGLSIAVAAMQIGWLIGKKVRDDNTLVAPCSGLLIGMAAGAMWAIIWVEAMARRVEPTGAALTKLFGG